MEPFVPPGMRFLLRIPVKDLMSLIERFAYDGEHAHFEISAHPEGSEYNLVDDFPFFDITGFRHPEGGCYNLRLAGEAAKFMRERRIPEGI